jgi:hypothetical protein
MTNMGTKFLLALCCNMNKNLPNPRTMDTERDWADAGQAIGSPNDPAIGETHNQTTGPGGNGLRAAAKPREETTPE